MNLRKRITVILSVGLFIVLLIGLNAYHTVQRLVALNGWVIHTHLVLRKIQQVQSQLTNLDNDLRGHLLSDNPFFKVDYDRNAQLITSDLRKLATLTVDGSQRERVRVLNALLRSKLAHSDRLFKRGAIATGDARLDSIRSVLDISDRFHLLMVETEKNEQALLVTRTNDSDQSARYAAISNGLGAVAALALIAWAIYLLVQKLESSNQLNKKLKDSEQRTQNFLEAVPISVVVLDVNGDFYYANKAATTLFGNTPSHFGNYQNTLKEIKVFRSSNGQPYPTDERPIYRAMQGETTKIDDMEMRLEGRVVQVMTSASPVYDSEGTLQYIISSTVDISDRVQSEFRLQQAKEMAEEAARLKENFLANMSHEIRTPLNAIVGFSNLLETTPLDTEQKEFITSVRTAGKNLLTIVNDILDMSKIEAGMLQFESVPFTISSLVGSIQTMFQSAAADKNLQLIVENDPTLPSTVLGDPTRLTQILLNLISNSIKFTKDGSVTVSIKKIAEADNAVRVQFVVSDTGIGMAAEVLPHIFERFQQATDFTTRYYGGTGLGLNIVKSLTEMQGGTITVNSTLGRGSRFTVEIPYPIAPEQPEPATNTVASPGADGHPLTVLIVEDNSMNQRLAVQVLKRLGYNTLVAENGQRSLEILQTEIQVDIILMDIQMPVMGGYETTRRIRNSHRSQIPIIAMTAHALASEREQCLQAGMNDFVPKPFQTEELQRILRKYLPIAATEMIQLTSIAPTKPAPKPSFSIDALMRAVDNDADFAAEMLTLFVKQTEDDLKRLQQAIVQEDLELISQIIHIQKVPTQMFDMAEATRIILDMEAMMASNKGIADVSPLVHQYVDTLNAELPAIRTALQTMLDRVSTLEG
ncbi:MAG: response regulator [Bacteroidetes bacterium]|nr:response regulator [Fibrella sp.]